MNINRNISSILELETDVSDLVSSCIMKACKGLLENFCVCVFGGKGQEMSFVEASLMNDAAHIET